MHDKSIATGSSNGPDEIAHKVIGLDIVDAYAMLDRDIDAHRIAHGFDAVGHQHRLGHQAGAKGAFLHPLRGTAAVQIDLIVTPLLTQLGAFGKICGFAAAELQGERMFFLIEIEVTRDITVQQSTGGDHLRIQPCMACNLPMKQTAMTIRPIHHGRDRYCARAVFHLNTAARCGLHRILDNVRTHKNSRNLMVYHSPLDKIWTSSMVTFQKMGKRWRARIRRKGFPALSEMFNTKARAQEWASQQEADMRALKFQDARIIADKTLAAAMDHYIEEHSSTKPLDENKADILKNKKNSSENHLMGE